MYSPRLKIEKLLFLAGRGVNRDASLNEAYRLIKLGYNPGFLRTLHDMVGHKFNSDDDMWLERASARFLKRKRYLEDRISYMRNYDETKRILYGELGQLHYDCGELSDALSSYVKELSLATMDKYLTGSHLKLILVCLKMGDPEKVLHWVDQARGHPMETIITAQVTCASALSHMGLGNYKTAAYEFLDVKYRLGDTFNEIILLGDVAIYGGLCALATFNQAEIKERILDNKNAWKVMGLAPEIKMLIKKFHKRNFPSCLKYLHSMNTSLLLDIYISNHVKTLFHQIEEKTLLEFAQPFASLEMHYMASKFNISVDDLAEKLSALITDNKLQAHIDMESKVLYRAS